MLEDELTEIARIADEIERLHQEKDEAWRSGGIWQQRYDELRAELDKAHRLIGQSIQWQRDAEIKLIKLRAAEEYNLELFRSETAECAKWLEQIRQVCADNAGEGCNHKMALDFVHQIAIRALKEQL